MSIVINADGIRQMMVAAREIDVKKLPESSRNWINEKLIYTHGYGVTMNTANGFTPEGMPRFIVSDMPVAIHFGGNKSNATRNLFWTGNEHRRLRQDTPEGI